MNKTVLIEKLATKVNFMNHKDVESAVKEILKMMSDTLVAQGRIEIRGFGSFCLHHRDKQKRRNPKTGMPVEVEAKSFPHFKQGKEMREAVNEAFLKGVPIKERD